MMIKFLFILIIGFILALFYQRSLAYLKIFSLKKKIKKNPLIGIKQNDGSYNYKEGGVTMNYGIGEPCAGIRTVQWFSLKRRLSFLERKIRTIKRSLRDFFIYRKWHVLFQPSIAIILVISLVIFYLGIKEYSFKQVRYFRLIAAEITGVIPESIEYEGKGWFKISGQKRSLDKENEPVAISVNPLSWLFFSNSANIVRWSKKLNKYIDYHVSINDKGDVWLGKKDGQIHGRLLGSKVIWDRPQKAGTPYQISGQRIAIEDGKLKILDE